MRQIVVIAFFFVAALGLVGCNNSWGHRTEEWARGIAGLVSPDTQSLADRCGAIMQAAMPYAQIELGNRSSEGQGVTKIVARIDGTRTDLPSDAPNRTVAAECDFTNVTLTGFRLTKGGPTPPPAP